MAKKARPTLGRGRATPGQRALIGNALPGLFLGMMPGQVRLSAREQQPRPPAFVPPKGKRGRGR
jgi:hypothetical protein